jgi:hypothetical protein
MKPSVTAVLEWKSRWTGNSDFKNDKKWMNEKLERPWTVTKRTLHKKIPVYIAFYRLVDENEIHFMNIYKRDCPIHIIIYQITVKC